MLCLRCSRGLNALTKLPITSASRTAQRLPTTRTFSSFTTPRPTLSSSFRPSLSNSATATPSTTQEAAILPFKISTHPAIESMQVRCAPRNTFNPSHLVRKRRHGFLARLKSRTGRMILKRRKAKKRSTLSH